MSSEWSLVEVEAIVADHLQMLTLELTGQRYSKADHRRQLLNKLSGRSEASIEFKHSNISAVLVHLGFPYIRGYQPRANYQALLLQVVESQLKGRDSLDQAALAAAQLPAVTPEVSGFDRAFVDPPMRQYKVTESERPWGQKAIQRDYLQREAHNRSLGVAGEEFVMKLEHWRLVALGQNKLADKVEHVSRTKGDGLGYDVLSFEIDGRERFIEVKTTAFGKDTPFFVTQNELGFSKSAANQFHLYRLFEFRKQPRVFDLRGEISQHCQLDPISFKASFS
ncbi:MAG: hypothetical protein RL758_1445 [Pseudomonadota bacterium]|jgi:hypothetical protein